MTPNPFSPDGDMIRDITYISYELSHDADWVAGNIYAVINGEQRIVAQVYTECLDYYWDPIDNEWVPFHVVDGIKAGLSTEKYYIKPVNKKDGTLPPFHMSDVAVSGERPSQTANRRQLRMWAVCVFGLNLRAAMSSTMRACKGLMERLTELLMGELLS